jgi:radical SAM protein with 4Fe4S-binding SPASM domain
MSRYARTVTTLNTRIVSHLRQLDIELTERCNNNCIHCCINLPAGDETTRSREVTTEQVEIILKQAADLGCIQVRFTGGEPLLRPDFEELYIFARRLGLKVLVFTNACLVTPRLAELLAKIPPLVPLEITVYGMRASSYEAVTRVPGSFSKFRRGVDQLLHRGVPFVVKYALLPPNRSELEEFEEWAATIPWMTRRPSYAMFFDLRNRREPDKNRLIESLRVTPREGLAVLTRDPASYRAGMAQFAARFMGPSGDRLFRCGAGAAICIDAYGRAQPCMGVRDPSLTVDVLTSSLSDAKSHFARLRDLRTDNPEYLGRCAECFLGGLCEQCPAKSWTENGTLDTPVEYLCEVAHAQARWLGWLRDGENAWDAVDWRERVSTDVNIARSSP